MPIIMMEEGSPLTLRVYDGDYDDPGNLVDEITLPPSMSGKDAEWTVYGADGPGNAPGKVYQCRMGRQGSSSVIALEF